MTVDAKTLTDSARQSSVDKALNLLGLLGELLADNSDGLRLTDLARAAGQHPSTVHRLLNQLKMHGFVVQDEVSDRYRLGPKILVLSSQFYGAHDLRRLALPFLRDLSHKTEVTAHLAILDEFHGVYIEKVESKTPIRLASAVGQRLNLNSSSLGKVMLAYSEPEYLQSFLDRPLIRRTARSITEPSTLLAELEQVRNRGYALDDEENEDGIRCLAAPIFDRDGSVEAAISVAGTVEQIPEEVIPHFSEFVTKACAEISQKLGWSGGQPGSRPSAQEHEPLGVSQVRR